MPIKKHDFIELEYIGKFKDGTVFDTTNKEVAHQHKIFSPQFQYKPMIVCVGEEQVVQGLDEALVGKEIGKEYSVDVQPEQAFGKKDIKKIRLIPIAEFIKRQMDPKPGMQIDLDGQIGTILRASGGRILVNFNHPFAGREITYEIKINKQITDQNEQLKAFLELSLNFPDLKTEVKEDKAEVTLPMELPEPVQEELGKKIKELIKLKEIKFIAEKTPPKEK